MLYFHTSYKTQAKQKKKKLEVQCMSLNWFIGQKSSVTYLSESTKNCVMCFCFLFMQSYKIMQVNDVT